MKLGFFQYDVIYRDPVANLDYLESSLKSKKNDLLVLPELFTTGYAFGSKEELMPFAETIKDSQTIKRLISIAESSHSAIVGTIPELDGNEIYNTAIVVSDDGLLGCQRKIHLTDYEKSIFVPGNEIKVFEYGEIKIGVMTCFDCWFPPLSSKLRQLGAHIICHPSCFGGAVTPKIIPVRALENQCFVVSCNRVGVEQFDGIDERYRGESQIVNPDGEVLYKAENNEELVFVQIDIDEVGNPEFGRQITSDFTSEHNRYKVDLLK